MLQGIMYLLIRLLLWGPQLAQHGDKKPFEPRDHHWSCSHIARQPERPAEGEVPGQAGAVWAGHHLLKVPAINLPC